MLMPDPRDLILTAHARERMEEYGFSVQDVMDVVALPEATYPDKPKPDANLSVIGTTADGRALRLVLAHQDRRRVVTVIWPDSNRGARA